MGGLDSSSTFRSHLNHQHWPLHHHFMPEHHSHVSKIGLKSPGPVAAHCSGYFKAEATLPTKGQTVNMAQLCPLKPGRVVEPMTQMISAKMKGPPNALSKSEDTEPKARYANPFGFSSDKGRPGLTGDRCKECWRNWQRCASNPGWRT